MIEKLKQDIESGKVTKLMLIETDADIIKNNRDGMMYKVIRDIIRHDNNSFTLKTERCINHMPSGSYCDCEAYYTAFNFYDGKILKSNHSTYQIMNQAA